MALGGSWALLAGLEAAPGAPKQALGCSGAALKKRVRPPGGSREPQAGEKRDFGPLVVFQSAPDLIKMDVSAIFEKKTFFLRLGPVGC